MSALVKETGAGLANANAYFDVAEGDAFAEDDLYAANWTSASADNKRKAAIMATRVLDEQVAWMGSKATEAQALGWPRYGVYDRWGYLYDSDVVPDPVKKAAWLLADALLGEDRTVDRQTGLSRVKAEGVEVVFAPGDRKLPLPQKVIDMIAPLGAVRGTRGPIRLVRT